MASLAHRLQPVLIMDACAQPRLALLYCPPPAMVSLLQADGVRPRGYEIVVAGPGGGAPKAVGARLRCPWRVFALDAKADVEAHIKDVALVVNCAGAGEDPTVLVQACVRLAIPYLDTEVIDCERVFDATLSAGQPPTAPVVSGLGAATAVLDCLGHLLRSRLSDGDLQHHNLKLFLAQSELAPEQAAKRVRRTFVPFIIRNGNKLVAGECRRGVCVVSHLTFHQRYALMARVAAPTCATQRIASARRHSMGRTAAARRRVRVAAVQPVLWRRVSVATRHGHPVCGGVCCPACVCVAVRHMVRTIVGAR